MHYTPVATQSGAGGVSPFRCVRASRRARDEHVIGPRLARQHQWKQCAKVARRSPPSVVEPQEAKQASEKEDDREEFSGTTVDARIVVGELRMVTGRCVMLRDVGRSPDAA